MKNIHIFGGGTISHIANHFAVCAPAFGKTARELDALISADSRFDKFSVSLELTKMAGGKDMETNADVQTRINELKQNPNTKIIILNCALVDYEPTQIESIIERPSKYEFRLDTGTTDTLKVKFVKSHKIIQSIRVGRKDIFLVGFKTTCGATKQVMYEKGLALCKTASANLVFVNDVKTMENFIVCPEEAVYGDFKDRTKTLIELIDIMWHRSHLTFTQSTVVDGEPVSWNSELVPSSLRTVVNYCINGGAYKPFNKVTAGHFACKLSDTEFLTSIRKTNLNDLEDIGLVYVKTDGPDTVIAYGAKPSVGGQSQRIVFNDHAGFDCIVHFHSELRKDHVDNISIISQRENECGSHQCGQATSSGLKEFRNGQIKAVMLDNHGPNIIFNRNIDPNIVIDFIKQNWDLTTKTGGYQF